jgi:NAD+ kinase
MTAQFDNIVIVGRRDDARIAEPLKSLTAYLLDAGIAVLEEPEVTKANLVIAIGGDGTMLYASRLVQGSGVPILGINRG